VFWITVDSKLYADRCSDIPSAADFIALSGPQLLQLFSQILNRVRPSFIERQRLQSNYLAFEIVNLTHATSMLSENIRPSRAVECLGQRLPFPNLRLGRNRGLVPDALARPSALPTSDVPGNRRATRCRPAREADPSVVAHANLTRPLCRGQRHFAVASRNQRLVTPQVAIWITRCDSHLTLLSEQLTTPLAHRDTRDCCRPAERYRTAPGTTAQPPATRRKSFLQRIW
jgi:hypothetical protein